MATARWQTLLNQLDSLTENNGVNAWHTAKIIVELSGMKLFHTGVGGQEQAEAKLQEYAGRFCVGLFDIIEMFKCFPKKEQWKDGRLDVLRDEMINMRFKKRCVEEKTQDKDGAKKKSKPRFSSLAKAEYERVKAELKLARMEIRKLRKRIKELEKEKQTA